MNAPPRTLVILNYHAARTRRAWPSLQAMLAGRGLRFDTHETAHAGDAETTTRRALGEGYGLIAVVGGDGTLSEAAAGFFTRGEERTNADAAPAPVNPAAALAVLPAGTGDDFARGLLKRRAPLEQWVEKLVDYYRGAAEGRAVDVLDGSADGGEKRFICLNAVTLGIGADVARRVGAQNGFLRRFSGEARFAVAALGALAAWRERSVRVSLDQEPALETTSNLIAVSNGIYAGGGMMFTPAAQLDDGHLDVMVVGHGTRRMIMRELTRIHSGGHLANPRVTIRRGQRVRIETLEREERHTVEADGNLRGRTPVEVSVLPAALRVVA